jgi:hypothetical protein
MALLPISVLLVASGLAATIIFLRYLVSYTHDAAEPPTLETSIPFTSALIGMRKKQQFYIDLR